MSKKKSRRPAFIVGLAIVLLLVIGGYTAFSRANQSVEDTEGSPLIEVEPASLDWGAVSAAQGPASREFTLTNQGDADLIIKKISTSCGCTTAVLKTRSGSSPTVGMDHGNLPSLREIIKPGETAVLTVTFDPNFHYVRGKTTRAVYINSNDPLNKEIEISSSLTVTE